MLTRVCRHDAEWQASFEHAASCQRRQGEPAACVFERIVQVGSLGDRKAIASIPVQEHFNANDGADDSGLRIREYRFDSEQQHADYDSTRHTAVTA